jgi:hypothetical protein
MAVPPVLRREQDSRQQSLVRLTGRKAAFSKKGDARQASASVSYHKFFFRAPLPEKKRRSRR